MLFGRGGEIRTPDILLPKQARYQAALHPEKTITRTESGIIPKGLIQVNPKHTLYCSLKSLKGYLWMRIYKAVNIMSEFHSY